ncbi:MAG TPA: hypothetical protein VFU33_11305 [Gaiellaceae bacterium]|nr:hypothetical protein [Gaiellaceae bacterium]
MRRLLLCVAVAAGALVAAPSVLADGPSFVTQGGAGVASRGGAIHWVAVSDGPRGRSATLLEKVSGGQVDYWIRLEGSWGTPTIGSGLQSGQGLSRDGHTLVLSSTGQPFSTPSRFLVVDLKRGRVVRTIALHGYFTFDALSPNASRMYVIEYTHGATNDVTHYIVRAYDMRTNRLLPGKIADRSEHEESMAGYAMTRTTSADGRWVYTLYQKPNGEPFVHALDTVRGAAYCIDLPNNNGLYNIVLSLRNRDRTLAAHWRSGRPWLDVAVGSWRISYPSAGFPWAWTGAGIGAALALLAAGALLLWRRRGKKVEQHAGQELGLA